MPMASLTTNTDKIELHRVVSAPHWLQHKGELALSLNCFNTWKNKLPGQDNRADSVLRGKGKLTLRVYEWENGSYHVVVLVRKRCLAPQD